MPANKKYLTNTPLQAFAKISAGFVGGYMVTEGLHLTMAVFFDLANAVMTLRYLGFVIWVGLMIVALLFKNGWKAWLLYLIISLIFYGLISYGKILYPIT